jgi:hypothetical protein
VLLDHDDARLPERYGTHDLISPLGVMSIIDVCHRSARLHERRAAQRDAVRACHRSVTAATPTGPFEDRR